VDRTAADPLVGQLLDGRYLVGARIARGGMATVYEATDLRLDRLVALKVMPQALADDETFRQRFVREARAAARLTHPNVVAVYDQGEDDEVLFLAMEFVAGRHTLRDVIRDEAPVSPTRALTILEEILKAIAAAHEAGIVHRDIKPENVLIDPRGQIKVADFGLARAISAATAATATGGVLMGTVSYLPPELVIDGSSDARSDVYALGVLLFELLTGTKPHTGESPIQVAYKHVHDDVPPPSTVVDGVPPYLDAFVARATSRQRDLRPADGHVMLQQLRRVRHALDNGVIDDEELTDDLTPTVAVFRPPADPADPAHPADPADPTGLEPPSWQPRRPQDEVFDVTAYDDFPTTVTPVIPATPGYPTHERTLVVGETREPPTVAPPPPPDVPYTSAASRASTAGRPPVRTAASPAVRQSTRRGWIALVVVLLLAAGAAATGWWYGVGRFRETPNVVNLTQTQAKEKVVAAGLGFEVADVAYSEDVPPGKVISTDPAPGDDVLRDGTVTVVVSQGPERHDVPRLDDMTESQAIDAITEASLTVGDVKRQYHETIPEGGIIGYSPKAGTPLRRDDAVNLVVSKGPVPIQIDDYTGQPADAAESALSGLGFDVKRKERYNDDVDAGLVISQKPNHGHRFAGDPITLVVSLGPHLIEVPDVYLDGVDAATETLEAAGFEVDVDHSDGYLGLGYVVSQDPDGGSMAPPGSTITISLI
jgi:beta-lactam-binding protein with PASTA domain/serine/threonine protein kinase